MGKYFEEFCVGDHYRTRARTITETDVVNYAGLSGDYNPLHTDAVFGESTLFGERVAHGMLGACIGIGLWTMLGLTEGTTLALMESNWKFVGPVRFGDTIHTEITVLETKRVSKPDRGILRVGLDVINQRGETTHKGQLVLMLRAKAPLF